MLQRVVDVVRPLVGHVVVIGPWAPVGVGHVVESEAHRGPLAGLVDGLHSVSARHALVLAADHPVIRPQLLGLLLERAHLGDAVVPTGPEGPQPLVAVYDRRVLAPAQELLDGGERRLMALLDVVDTRWLAPADWRRVDPDGVSFLDVDRPGDLAGLEDAADPRTSTPDGPIP
jgi:molybdopterin-guanine dinucleotide biosynthesis protein A